MKDMVPKGTGNSRYLKSVSNFMTLYPTYADFVAALVAGTLPVDFNGINSAGCNEVGTPLNKESLLTDATLAKLGVDIVGAEPTVSIALGILADFKAGLDSNGKVMASQITSSLIDVTANKTLASSDNGKSYLCYSADVVITVPDASSFSSGYEIEVIRWGSNAVTIQGASGVKLNGVNGGSKTIQNRYKSAVMKLVNRANNQWLIQGDIL